MELQRGTLAPARSVLAAHAPEPGRWCGSPAGWSDPAGAATTRVG